MSDQSENEIGRELSIADLKPPQVVVIAPPDRDERFTIWVKAVDADAVTFFAGTLNMYVINFIKDGQIVDDRGRVVRVFEYLGAI